MASISSASFVTLLTLGLFAAVPVSSAAADAVAVDEAATAEDPAPDVLPLIEIEGSAEVQADIGIGKRPRTSAIYATVEPELTVNLSEYFRVHGHFIFEPVRDPVEGRMNTFRSQGIYAEELFAGVSLGEATFQFGKINPEFGVATDEAPGIYGFTFAEGYDFKGALGAQAKVSLSEFTEGSGEDAVTTKQILFGSVFTADPSVLSRSFLTDRGLYRPGDYRVGNNDLPESFTAGYAYNTLNADDEVAGPTARVAMRRLAARQAGVPDEWDILAAVQTSIDLGDDLALRPIAELAYLVHEGGHKRDAGSATIGAELQQGPWFASLVGAMHDTFGSSNPSDYLLTASIGREFETDTTGAFRVDAAYSYGRVDAAQESVIGLRLYKDFSLSYPGAGPE
ncbi:MAG: hypothetical protein JWM58_2174 [Rhizobium sp.]|nr:hypothetical protein [Rhizobium sp.]